MARSSSEQVRVGEAPSLEPIKTLGQRQEFPAAQPLGKQGLWASALVFAPLSLVRPQQ